jgi:lysophospholipase L1-like esterase
MAIAFVAAACSGSLEAEGQSESDQEAEPAAAAGPVYLALGDSLAVGVGATDWPTGGYVPRLHALLNAARPANAQLELVNVGRSGADSVSVIDGGQLSEAIAVIEERRATASTSDDVEVITIGVGGNDGFGVVALCDGVVDDACLERAEGRIRDVRKNLLFITRQLQAAAGPDVQIAVMTYYNPLIHEGCPLHEFELIGDVVLEGQVELGVPEGLNDEIRAAAEAAGVPVAEVGELTVAELTGDCLHASDAGHARIAAAFEAAFHL